MGTLVIIVGLTILLVVFFQRAASIAMVGSVLSVTVGFLAVVFMGHTALPEAIGLLYIAIAVAIWAASPPAEELADSLGGETPFERARKDPTFRATLPVDSVDPDTGDTLTGLDHLWLVGLPLLGFVVTFVALPLRTGLEDGVWGSLIFGNPGVSPAVGVTDISALFGLILVFPGGPLALALPVTGAVAVMIQLAQNRETAAAAAMEYLVTLVVMNLIALYAFPLYRVG